MKFLKIIFPVTLALIIIASCFYSVSFFVERSQLRQEIKSLVKQGLSEEKLTQFVFTEAEFENLTFAEENEFYLNHTIYDIVKTQRPDGKVIVLALNDNAERELFKDLDDVVSNMLGNDKSGNSPLKSLGKIVSLKYLATENFDPNPALVLSIQKYFILTNTIDLQDGFSSAPFSPPELA